jgi:hypothetical protein
VLARIAFLLAVTAPEVSSTEPAADAQATATDPAPDPNDEAALEQAAQRAFAGQRYDDVVRYAARAFEVSGDYRHLYAQAHAERFRGNCATALGLYARVMAAEPDSELGELARRGIALCGDAAPDPAPAPTASAPPDPAPTPTTSPTPTDPQPAHRSRAPVWLRDATAGVLMATGVAAVAAGAGLWVQSSADLRASDRADDEAEFVDRRGRAQGFRVGAVVAFSVGGALVTGAAIRYGLVARRSRNRAISLAPAPGRGLVVGWSTAF